MECHCIVLHAITPEDRERVVKELDRARHAGDSKAITLCLAQLSACPFQNRTEQPVATE
jgi:predicted MarR family transcription regulator